MVAGQTYQYPGSGHWAFSLLRYDTNGSLDTTFGSGGIVATPTAGNGTAWGVAIQSDGRIVAAGTAQLAAGTNSNNFMTARYLPGPEVGTFTASANTVTAGSSLTLTASNITDGNPGSTITQVAIYYLDGSGNKVMLGYGTQTSPGVWTFTFNVNLTAGSYTLYAQAEDSNGVLGDPFALPFTVQ